MIKTRAKLETLRKAVDQVLELLPLPQRLVLAPMLEAHFQITTDLIEEIDKLKHGSSSPLKT